MDATARRSDLPASAQACFDGVGTTHKASFQVNDQNFCDENPTGAVTRNIFVNGIRLVQNLPATATSQGTDSNDVRIFRTPLFFRDSFLTNAVLERSLMNELAFANAGMGTKLS